MSSIGTGYDLSAGTFSPDGRIFQVEYAQKAIDNSGTAIGLRGKDAVVFAVEKIITTKLHEPNSLRRICNVDQHIGVASSGLYPDAKALAAYCREECQDFFAEYRQKIPLKFLADRLSYYMHAHTLYSSLRPFGCSILLSSWEEHVGPELFMVEPSGLVYGFNGCAVGKARQAAKTEIEKLKLADMSKEELLRQAARIIHLVREETKEKQFELEVSWVGKATNGKHEAPPPEAVREAERWALEQLDAQSDSEEMQA